MDHKLTDNIINTEGFGNDLGIYDALERIKANIAYRKRRDVMRKQTLCQNVEDYA